MQDISYRGIVYVLKIYDIYMMYFTVYYLNYSSKKFP